FPEYEFDHQDRPRSARRSRFETPSLTLPEGFGRGRLTGCLDLLRHVDRQRAELDRNARAGRLDRAREGAVSLLTDAMVRRAFDLERGDPKVLDRYGRN